jgi:hypothetical protein
MSFLGVSDGECILPRCFIGGFHSFHWDSFPGCPLNWWSGKDSGFLLYCNLSTIPNRSKIAVKEAIPYEEFKQNPNTVLLTSSLGGHLCWFETSGDRWFTKPVSSY